MNNNPNNNLVYNTYNIYNNNTRRMNPSQPHNKTKRVEVSTPKKEIYPDQLNITIRTSVPGYQKVQYIPSMTIKNTNEKSVIFNPMIKLNKYIVDKIPKEYRAKQFINNGLFNSLLIMNDEPPVDSLIVATRRGYVDNNIKVTLDALFPVGSVIYFGNSPYSIGNVQWTSGDWKINVKQKEEIIEPSKFEDPFLRSQIINNEIKEGIKQINNLPRSVVAGNNYMQTQIFQENGEKVTENKEQENKEQENKEQENKEQENKEQEKQALVVKSPNNIVVNKSLNNIHLPTQQHNLLLEPEKQIEEIQESPKAEEISTAEPNLYDGYTNDLQSDNAATSFFRSFFRSNPYYNLMNLIYKKFNTQIKGVIRQFYYETTRHDISSSKKAEGLSPTYYTELCNSVSILNPKGDGNCFFKAVAEGINIHNSNNPNDMITYGIYGKTQLFTIRFLRELVYDYYTEMDETAKNVVYNLAKQDNYINGNVTMETYIKSNAYWADQMSFNAVCRKLKICIIPIKKNDRKMETLLITPNDIIKLNCSERVMFLYHNVSHYELIKFSYKVDKRIKNVGEGLNKVTEYYPKPFTIFKKNKLVPPIHVLFLLYATAYAHQEPTYKDQFALYKEMMVNIDMSVKKILSLPDTDITKINFVKTFDKLFPHERSISEIVNMSGGNYNPINTNTSKIAYDITIDMELHAGDHLTSEQIKQSACNNKYNAIRRAFAEFTGRPYVIPPVYPVSSKKGGNKTRKLRN